MYINIYKKKKPRLLDDGPEKIFSETQRVREREWQLWSALYRAATAALIYSSICSPR